MSKASGPGPTPAPGVLRALPIRARIALFGTAVVVLAVVAFGGLVDLLFERSVYGSQDQVLQHRSQQVAGPPAGRTVRLSGFPRRIDARRPEVPVDLRTSGDTFTEFLDAGGGAIFSTGEIDGRAPRVPAAILREARTTGHALVTIQDSGLAVRVSVRPVLAAAPTLTEGQPASTGPVAVPALVVVGQSATAVLAEVNQLRLYIFLAALLSLVGALAASWIVAGRALRPLDDMTATVEAVGSASDLRRRLPAAPAPDEVGRLTGAFNGMMGRLEEAYGRLEGALDSQRRFVADASHELRTPLTTIRTNLGLLLGRNDIDPRDRREALRDMQGEAERMSRLVEDLLTLARADAGQVLEMERVDLVALCEEVCRLGRRTYPGRRIDLSRPAVPPLMANADSLRQLLWILLDNAARHGGQGGNTRVSLVTDDEGVVLSVTDDGAGLDPGDHERVFERFYRSDRARGAGGAGLGLSIARWIVQQHGGHISAGPNPAGWGARFTVRLPLGSPPGERTATQRLNVA